MCSKNLQKDLRLAGVRPLADQPTTDPHSTQHVNRPLQHAISELVRQRNLSLKDLIKLWHHELPTDTRPNKALDPDNLAILLRHYDQRDRVLNVVRNGVQHLGSANGEANRTIVKNHKSALILHKALSHSVRKGQDNGTYLVVDVTVTQAWNSLHFSPFGCIPKADCDPTTDARVIHDLSYGDTGSTNSLTDQEELPSVRYIPIQQLVERIEHLRKKFPLETVKIMKGDVKSAFRHIPVAASMAHWFAGTLPDNSAAVVDLALPFGWSGSPAYYGIFGGAITHLVSRESPAPKHPTSGDTDRFFGYEWVDDHILIEIDRGNRLTLGDAALRLAMLAVLGPRAINESKFTPWTTSLTALGLIWDTACGTVSMPEEKIVKALLRVDLRAQ